MKKIYIEIIILAVAALASAMWYALMKWRERRAARDVRTVMDKIMKEEIERQREQTLAELDRMHERAMRMLNGKDV